LATFELIVVAAAFDRWRMRGLASGRSRTGRVRRSQVSGFQRPWFPIRPAVKVESSNPYKARSVPGERAPAGVQGTTVPMCALITFTTERRTDVR
jgi:hypothetical protein